MTLKQTLIASAVALAACWCWGKYQYHEAWDAGRQELVTKQQEQQAKRILEQAQRQQENDRRAQQADDYGSQIHEDIQNDLKNYVARPDRDTRRFDDDRVRIKRRAAENAATIPGYDD